MKLFLLIVFNILFFCICFSQRGQTGYLISPDFNLNNYQTIKNQSVINDSIYSFKKRKNNHDSTLILARYYDSLGNLIESDQFDINKTGVLCINSSVIF